MQLQRRILGTMQSDCSQLSGENQDDWSTVPDCQQTSLSIRPHYICRLYQEATQLNF